LSDKSDILESIRKAVEKDNDGFCVTCTVDSVDLTDMSCYCVPVKGGADILGVRLIANNNIGFVMIPTVGSLVVVSFLSDQSAYVSMFSAVSEIRINGVVNGGLVKIDDLKTQWDLNFAVVKSAVATALAVVDTQLIVLGQPGGSVAAFNAAAASILNLNKITLENTTVKHGNG
jgi:hypothetical protein